MNTEYLLCEQNEAIEHLKEWKCGALFMEAGTGKTRAGMEIIKLSPCDSCFWIAPLRTLDNVRKEFDKWGGLDIPVNFVGIESISQSDRIYLQLLETIKSYKSPFVVVDESLKIKNMESKRTQRMLNIGTIVDYKLILNGTPLSRNLLDLWAQMEFLSPLIINMTYKQFKDTFCEYNHVTKIIGRKRIEKEYITGYENIDYLYSLIRHYIYECDLHLNITQNYHVVNYKIAGDRREEYNSLKNLYLRSDMLELKNNKIFMEMTQKMQHSYCCEPNKIETVKRIFENECREDETIIFCKYVDSREICERNFPKAKILSYQRESYGLNLQEYHNTIYFDKIWDLSLKVQSGRRSFRTGQEYDCHYWELTGDVGLESMIDKNITKKVSMTEYFKKKTKEQIFSEL